jgi:spore coat polysaccharide biosynthesis protein SpsF
MMDAIIQARLGSTRFPAKLLEPLDGKPLLKHVVDNLKKNSKLDRIIIATTTSVEDDRLQEYCESEGLLYYRGAENEVLNRFLGASRMYGSERFLRVCSDNPFIDNELMTEQIEAFSDEFDYCSFYTRSDEPLIVKPIGFFVEGLTRRALEIAAVEGVKDHRTQEHVTYYIHSHPNKFRIKKLLLPEFINPDLRFTIDYPEDMAIAESILSNLNSISSAAIMDLVDQDDILRDRVLSIAKTFPKEYMNQGVVAARTLKSRSHL